MGPGQLAGLCGPSFLPPFLSRPKLGSQIQVGAGEFMCGERESDRVRTPPASPPKLHGNFVKYVLLLENPRSGWNPQEAGIESSL